MKLTEVFPSNYLKAADLNGATPVVTIKSATMEKLGDDQKLILYFEGKEKGMVCNKTNAGRIAFMYGEDTDDWIGGKIILASEFVEFQGKSVQGLRVRQPPSARVAAPPASPPRPEPISTRQTYSEVNPPPHDDVPF